MQLVPLALALAFLRLLPAQSSARPLLVFRETQLNATAVKIVHMAIAAVPRELAPHYEMLSEALAPQLAELKHLSSRRRLMASDRRRVEDLLTSIGTTVVREQQLALRDINSHGLDLDERLQAHEAWFGHVAGSYSRKFDYLGGACVDRALSHLLVLDALGGSKTGVLRSPSHTVPTVKIRGTTYVLDLPEMPRAMPLREYLRTVREAYRNPAHPAHRLVSGNYPAAPSVFERYFKDQRYRGGERGAMAAVHYNFAMALQAMNRFEDAESLLRKSLELDPYWMTRMTLSKAIHYQGRHAEAESVLAPVLRERPREPYAHVFRSILLLNQGRRDEARQEADTAEGLDPNDPEIRQAVTKIRQLL